MSGYGVPVGLDEPASGEQCPQCGETDLRPYGNGSKWACPRCYFLLPCCEGGELAVRPPARLGWGAPMANPGRPCSREAGPGRRLPAWVADSHELGCPGVADGQRS